MARDASLYVRKAVVALLKGAVVANAPLPAARIYAQKPPADAPYEKLQYGQPVTTPFSAGCLDGSSTAFAVHSFAETTGTGAQTVGGEARAHALVAWAASVLGGGEHALTVDLQTYGCPFPAVAHIEWTGTQVFADGLGTDAFHGIATFTATVSS